jgi:hypothetical protein
VAIIGATHVTALSRGVAHPILSLFKDGTDGFWFDGTNLYQTTAGQTEASSAGDAIGLALDQHETDGRGVVNLFTYSEQFDNAAWTKFRCTISADATTDPDGGSSADALVQAAGQTTLGLASQSLTGQPGSTAGTWSAYAKKGDKRYFALGCDAAGSAGANVYSWFDLDTGTKGTIGSGYTGAMEDIGGGWYRCSVSFTSRSGGGDMSGLTGHADTNGSLTVTDSGQTYIWGAQFERASAVSAYQSTEAAGSGLGGPGNHGTQSTSGSRPTLQTGPLMRSDGVDDNLLTTLNPAAAFTMLGRFAVTSASKVVMGSRATTDTRAFIGTNASGLLAGGVGADSIATINGGSDIRGTTGVGALSYDGTTVKLYWNGAEIYSAAQNGTPNTSVALRVGAFNDNGTAGSFADADIYHAIAIKKALTASEIGRASTWLANN